MFFRPDAETIRHSLSDELVSVPSEVFQKYFSSYGFKGFFETGNCEHAAATIKSGDDELVVQLFSPSQAQPKGTVFLLHGYFDHVGLYQHIIRFCLEQEYAVFIFDFPGHGLSSGKVASINSFDQYSSSLLDVLRLGRSNSLPEPWHLAGQSTGAAVILSAIFDDELQPFDALTSYTLLAPLVRPHAWATSKLLFSMSSLFIDSTARHFSQNSHDQEFLLFLKETDQLQSKRLENDWVKAMIEYQKKFLDARLSDLEITVIQGTDDTTVDWKYNTSQLRAKFPKSTIHYVEGARHHLVNESVNYREKVFELFRQQLSK